MKYAAYASMLVPLTASLYVAAAQAADEDTVQAVWKPQEISFFYQSFTTFYSCDALEDRIERILQAVGAQEVTARASGCVTNGPTRSPHVRLTFMSPVEATPEALQELKESATQRELVAKVRGERPTDLTAQFPAQWRTVNLSRGHVGIEPGECELIEQLNKTLFPKLAIEVVSDKVNCLPHRQNLTQPSLQVKALVEAPKPDDAGEEADSG